MGSQLVQAQWSLNQTSDSIYSIARGVLQAATSDNVQPLAIMACEQFGNTLAISHETRLRIERTVLPTAEPDTIRFLKVKVGFMKHDCAVQLGSNQAGLRFLGLAAALISSVSAYQCANALMLMLESTTSDERFLPTTRQLTDLMSSIEGRCCLSGFTDVVYGYNSIIVGASLEKGFRHYNRGDMVPEPKGLAALVDACRQLQKTGGHEISSITVEACQCAAWAAAFVKWCAELPPSICFSDGTSIIHQPGSQFTIIVLAERTRHEIDIKVIKRYKLDSIQDLVIQYSSHFDVNYSVSLRTYISLLWGRTEHYKWAMDAILAALPLAITVVHERLWTDSHQLTNPLERPVLFSTTRPSPFPSDDIIFRTMSAVFGLRPDFPFPSLASSKSFRDLPEIEKYFLAAKEYEDMGLIFDPLPDPISWGSGEKSLSEVSWWAKYDIIEPGSHSSPQLELAAKQHGLDQFIKKLAIMCRSILLLSLFDDIQDLRFAPPSPNCAGAGSLYEAVASILTATADSSLSSARVSIEAHMLLIGLASSWNNDQLIRQELVSSTRTHVFWYSILDDFVPKRAGTHRITSRRGHLMHDRQTYNVVRDRNNVPQVPTDPRKFQQLVDSTTRNFGLDFRIQWELTAHEDYLESHFASSKN
ncbi:hypothetical protein O1611_g5527 [Lasiodiplodia mahajangana]|uniref:Uncharacterized protein n=1 Tax=Lasiodiplodia mahajangana TaxID=1108764 RepID=A0ACC2JL82_9PEZI|nr:hypothetical protein O1611_g5527 [Lasiodiplodia mahajangana]